VTFKSIKFGSDDFKKECDLRHRVLRVPIGLDLFGEDFEPEKLQKHFGLFDSEGELVACVVAVPVSATAAKIRQMAVSPAYQKQGLGEEIMRRMERELAASGARHLSMHARTTAAGFYEKLGYAKVGGEFSEVGIPHILMEKRLKGPLA